MSLSADLLATQGFAMVSGVLSHKICENLAAQVQLLPNAAGTRTLIQQKWCADLAMQLRAHPSLQRLIPTGYRAIQCNYFEKSLTRNWLVSFHQDISIPVAKKIDTPLLSGWSEKEGSWFVQAPKSFLARIIAVRIHLDNCSLEDGPLRVIAGSHLNGIIAANESTISEQTKAPHVCVAERGDALVLNPLLLHASSKSLGRSR